MTTSKRAHEAAEVKGAEPAAVRAQLERVLASPGFARSPRMAALLRYVVERTLKGEAAYLKEYSIALDVFEREVDFDPQTNPVVRVQASKLRRLLSLYFLEEGRNDPLEIELPRGAYVPAWHVRSEASAASEPSPQTLAGEEVDANAAPAPETTNVHPETAEPTVAVLPFTVLGMQDSSAEHDSFAEGLVEEVVTGLSGTHGLHVAARQLARHAARQQTDVRELGRELGVGFVLEGSLRAAGSTTRIVASLIEARRGVRLWSDRFDAQFAGASLLDLQDELGREVVRGVCEALGVSAPTEGGLAPATPLAPERRQITVMQCQLASGAAINSKLDPEDAFDSVRAFQRAVTDAVTRYSGHVARQSGENVLAYFGYPQAHEDDAERSLRAGLDALQRVEALDCPLDQPLLAHAGIATGPVIIGGSVDNDTTEAVAGAFAVGGSVVGAALGIAERLRSLAKPGELLAGPRTCRLAGHGFEYEVLPAQTISDVEPAVVPRRVVGLTTSRLRFESAHAGELGPIVGRDEELELLLRRWRSAQAREGQVVAISGEAGIGKSRLAWALGDAIAADTRWRVRYQCSPYHSATALHPIAERVRRSARMAEEDDDATRLAKLEQLLGATGRPLETDLPPIAALLGIALDERYEGPSGSPERQRELLLDTLEAQAVALARRRPTLTIFEDVQWADPTSLELFERVVERALSERLLILVTHRPEFHLPWEGYSHITTLQLARIGRESARAIVEHSTGGRPLPVELTRQILDKTDGVPLFVEELTRAVVETGLASEAQSKSAQGAPLTPLTIPDTLQDSLMARLDRLSPVKRVAQVAAAIGREFSYATIEAVADVSPEVLNDALQRLVESGLVFRRGQPPRAQYQFKHGLVRDAAYATLLRAPRHELHARIANVFEERFPALVEATPELLAHHLTECGEDERAVDCWDKAGSQALARHAADESCQHYQRALALLGEQPESSGRGARELRLRIELGSAILKSTGYHTRDARASFERAFVLSESVGTPTERFWALAGIFLYHWVGGDLPNAQPVCERLGELARSIDDPGIQSVALVLEGDLRTLLGEAAAGVFAQDRALETASPDTLRPLGPYLGGDPGVIALSFGAINEWLLGRLNACVDKERRARLLAEQFDDPISQAIASRLRALRLCVQHETEPVIAETERLIALCTEQGFDLFLVRGRGYRGFALCLQGQVAEGLAELSQCNTILETTGALAGTTHLKAMLAAAFDLAGDRDAAWRALEQAFEDMEHRNERMFEPELHLVRGDLLLARSNGAKQAEASYQLALETAHARGTRALKLRPALRLANLWKDRRKKKQARELLESVCVHFEDDDRMPDLDAARDLMSALHRS
ncbi:MAG: AAA family ATPase [Gammaproteobacteria bacterium]